MKKRLDFQHRFIVLILLLSIIIFTLYLTRNLTTSSCHSLSGKASISFDDFPEDAIPAGEPCPAPQEAGADLNPPGSGTTGSSSSGSSGSSSSKKSRNEPLNSPENETNQTIEFSPENPENDAPKFPQELVNKFIEDYNLDMYCTISNKSVSDDSWIVTIRGNINSNFLWIKVKVPTTAQLFISSDEILLQCINTPWWSRFIQTSY